MVIFVHLYPCLAKIFIFTALAAAALALHKDAAYQLCAQVGAILMGRRTFDVVHAMGPDMWYVHWHMQFC